MPAKNTPTKNRYIDDEASDYEDDVPSTTPKSKVSKTTPPKAPKKSGSATPKGVTKSRKTKPKKSMESADGILALCSPSPRINVGTQASFLKIDDLLNSKDAYNIKFIKAKDEPYSELPISLFFNNFGVFVDVQHYALREDAYGGSEAFIKVEALDGQKLIKVFEKFDQALAEAVGSQVERNGVRIAQSLCTPNADFPKIKFDKKNVVVKSDIQLVDGTEAKDTDLAIFREVSGFEDANKKVFTSRVLLKFSTYMMLTNDEQGELVRLGVTAKVHGLRIKAVDERENTQGAKREKFDLDAMLDEI